MMIKKFVSAFILGLLIGSSLIIVQCGKQIDNLHFTIQQMQLEIDQEYNYRSALEQELKEGKKNRTIRQISIKIANPPDSLSEIEFIKILTEKVKFLLGKNIDEIVKNKELLREVLNNRVIYSGEKIYRTKIDSIYFSTTLEIVIEVKEENLP